MDRQIIYAGAIPLETDLLSTNKNMMVGLSKLSAAILGTGIVLNGFTCVPTGVASLQVQLTAGEIYSLQNIDGTAYSSIALDTTHQIVKQGILLDTVLLTATPPVTAGQSINYLVQVTYQDSDLLPVVLPYYNASNPSVAYSGPANTGTTNNTVRKGVATVGIKAGIAATTGSQTTPAPDSGYTGMFVVTVANGQTTITSPNISTLAGAPFATESLLQKVGQASTQITANAAGTSDAITATITPAITALVNGMSLIIRASFANTSATPTFTVSGLASKSIVKGSNLPLVAGDIAGAGHWVELQYDLAFDKWVMQNPATGVSASVFTSKIQSLAGTGVVSNQLIASLQPTALDFRATPLTSGVINTRSISTALSLTVPSTATLGTISAQISRLVLLAIDNAGTVELAIVNIAGGNNLDETTLINTTAIAAGSNTANIIYSTTARTGVPFRVVGYIESTQATAGTWATAPSTIQGYGGQALAAMSSLGYGQTWQSVTRVVGTTYYNPTGRVIKFNPNFTISTTGGADSGTVLVNGLQVSQAYFSAGSGAFKGSLPVEIPPGASYSMAVTGSAILNFCTELR